MLLLYRVAHTISTSSILFYCMRIHVVSGHRHRDSEIEWHDFERRPTRYETFGNPLPPNPSLKPTSVEGTLSEPYSDCRLRTVTDCCQGVWLPQWWQYQQEMDKFRDYYTRQYRNYFDEDAFQDPIVERLEDFKVPMEAAATNAYPHNGKYDPYLMFRCVLILAPNSLLAFVAAIRNTTGKAKRARWSRFYRVYCHGATEYPKVLEVDTQRVLSLERLIVPRPEPTTKLQTRSGFCMPFKTASKKVDHQSPKGVHKRTRAGVNPENLYDPTTNRRGRRIKLPHRHENELIVSHVKILAGYTGCLDVPRDLLSTGTVIEPILLPVEESSVADLVLQDLNQRDINPDNWDVQPQRAWQEKLKHSTSYFSFDAIEPRLDVQAAAATEITSSQNAGQHLLLRALPMNENISNTQSLPSDEQRARVRDIDWDALFEDAQGAAWTKVTACTTAPWDHSALTYDMQLRAWDGSNAAESFSINDGGAIEWP